MYDAISAQVIAVRDALSDVEAMLEEAQRPGWKEEWHACVAQVLRGHAGWE